LTEIAQEISLSVDWLAANGASFGIAGPVVLSGWSAGGHLVALTLDHPAVTPGLAISGVYDLAPIRDTSLNIALKMTDDEIAALSPLCLPIVRKPLAIAYGSAELPALVWDSKRFHDARSATNESGELVAVDGADHFHPGRTATAGWKTGEARSGAGGKVVLIKGSRKASLTQSTLPRTRPPWHRSRFARP
jgi:arylformamidase